MCRLLIALIVTGVIQLSWKRTEAVSMWPKIHFTAYQPVNRNLVRDETIVLQTVVANDGQGYDNKTGIFTCPFSGLYTFSLQHCVDRDKYSHVGIMKDNTLLIAGVAYGTMWYPCSSMQAFVSLKKGEQVWSKSTWESYLNPDGGPARWTTLSGVLLRPDGLSSIHLLSSFDTE